MEGGKGCYVKSKFLTQVTDRLEELGIEWSLWNAEDVWFHHDPVAHLEVQTQSEWETMRDIVEELGVNGKSQKEKRKSKARRLVTGGMAGW